ncbi:MAG TPA: serine/threonine-protein kinase [Archangium sp.]
MSSAGTTDTSLSQSVAFAPGTLVLADRFRIVRLLGRGGMGIVYVAEQVSLGRQVALKVLRSDVSHAEGFAERFRREALLLSSVEHPAVVRVIDYGEHAGAQCLVMEYVEGESLEVVLQREAPLAVERVELLLAQLAQGLSAIHAKGIVHRDLKPENVLLTRSADGGFEQARLLDFGIARLMDVPGETSSVTQAGMVLGTPEYVSPEQALGQALDARSDLYSLGVILFRALTGKHPFPGPSPREFISQHIHQPPPPLLELAPHLSAFPGLVAAVTGCLQKDPNQRPQTASALFALSTSKPLQLIDTKVPAPVAPSHTRNLKAVVIGAGVGATVALAVWAFWFNEPTRKAERLVGAGRGSEALQVLDEMGEEKAKAWPLQQLRATALHQVGRHDEEQKLLTTFPETEPVSELALEALCDDFGRTETPRVRKILAGLPKASALPLLQSLAKDDQRWAQWGALRFVDLEYAGQGLPLLELYANALESKDCGIRRVAAKRLVDFRSTDAVPALEKLKALPREKGEAECGQAAADAALKQLARE